MPLRLPPVMTMILLVGKGLGNVEGPCLMAKLGMDSRWLNGVQGSPRWCSKGTRKAVGQKDEKQ